MTGAFCPANLCRFLPSRDELKRHYNLGQYWVEVEMEDLASFDEDLADYLYKQPAEHLQLVRMEVGNLVGNLEHCHIVRAALTFCCDRPIKAQLFPL